MRRFVSRISRTVVLAALFFAAIGAYSALAEAHTMGPSPATTPLGMKCEALAGADLARVPDAPTHINAAKLIEAAADKPSYCEIDGYVAPQVGILMWLPAERWNGKFMEVGCGGFCGSTAYIANCEAPLRKGYACITTDMGQITSQVVV